MDGDLPERHPDVGEQLSGDIDLAPPLTRARGDAARLLFHGLARLGQRQVHLRFVGLLRLGDVRGDVDVHGGLCGQRARQASGRWADPGRGLRLSLRRHDPDQVRPVRRRRLSQRLDYRPRENGGTLGSCQG